MAFTRVMPLAELWSGEKIGIELEGRPVLLVRLGDAVHAYEDRCLHKRARLSRGELHGNLLRCSAHAWEYDVATGGCVNPCGLQLQRYDVRVHDGAIWVDVGATAQLTGGSGRG